MKKPKKKNAVLQTIITHIQNNKKQYAIVAIIFLIGLIIGVSLINNEKISSDETSSYINEFIGNLKNNYQIDKANLFKKSITNYLIIAVIMWFMGSTVIGIPVVYLIVAFKGFSLGYTISCIMLALGTLKGTLFTILSLLLQNIISIPCILALAVSGMKLYKSIIKDKRKENIKIEILRHTVFSLFITGILVIASVVEVYISSSLVSGSINLL